MSDFLRRRNHCCREAVDVTAGPAAVGGGVIMTLSDLGFLPKVDLIPLQTFDQVRHQRASNGIKRCTASDILGIALPYRR